MKKEIIEREKLSRPCPFCKGQTEYIVTKFTTELGIHFDRRLVHIPDSGINCLARCEQACNNLEQAENWWNPK